LVQSMQPMVSFYRGAKNGDAMRTSFRIGVVVTLGFACLAAGAMLLFAHPLTELFVPNSENAWRVLRDAVPWVAMAIVPAALNIAVAGYLTAIEAPLESMIIALLRSWLLLLGLLFLLTFLFEGQGIWMTTVTTEVLTFAASAWLYLSRGKHAQVFAV
jgi:Na+-driven multidrug efflux pump